MNPKTLRGREATAYKGLRALQALAHKTANDAGWYRDPKTGEAIPRNFGEVVALMHSELSEALEADRKGLMDDKLPHRDGREVEFADAAIRIADTMGARGAKLAHVTMSLVKVLQQHSLADVRFALTIIRIAAECEASALHLGAAVVEKNRYNRKRADHKLAARANGGKRY